jgi:hypothetical protein
MHLNRTQQKKNQNIKQMFFLVTGIAFSCKGASRTHNLAALLYFSTSSYASKNGGRKTSSGTKFALKWHVP